MPKCPICKKMVRGSDKIKVKGVWQHHHSPVKKLHKEIILKPRSEGMSKMVVENRLRKIFEMRYATGNESR